MHVIFCAIKTFASLFFVSNICFFVVVFVESIALAETVAYLIEDDSDGPFYTKDLVELYKTRLKELGDIDYRNSLSWLDLQVLDLQLFHKAAPFFAIYSSKLQSLNLAYYSITNIPE